MNNDSTTNTLRKLEEQYWQAIKDHDTTAIVNLTHEPTVVTGAQGVGSLTKAQMKEMMEKQAQWTLTDFKLKDVQVNMLGPDTGIVAYTVHEELTVEGKPVRFDAADASVWVRSNGKWACALHTESVLGDPFGRDRGKG
ncbi:MAG: nuclear transport factor 2 family protein [Flavobacteriales bacterium]